MIGQHTGSVVECGRSFAIDVDPIVFAHRVRRAFLSGFAGCRLRVTEEWLIAKEAQGIDELFSALEFHVSAARHLQWRWCASLTSPKKSGKDCTGPNSDNWE
jgi:hypothetical protein